MFTLKRHLLLYSLGLILLIVGGIRSISVHCAESPDITSWYDSSTGRYRCPITENSPEYLALEDAFSRKQLFQIPEEILSDIPTDNLLEMILEFPYLGDVMLYDSAKEGLESLSSSYNGIAELLERSDLYETVSACYKERSDNMSTGQREFLKTILQKRWLNRIILLCISLLIIFTAAVTLANRRRRNTTFKRS